MARAKISRKRLQIDKANASMVISIAVAAFLVIFSLVSARALWAKRNFQERIIGDKELAVGQLQTNLAAVDELMVAYKVFVETPDNLIGGNPGGSGDRDGDNAKIILDALPSKYDFPALATSLEKILKSKNYRIDSISGTDDEIAQSTVASDQAQVPLEIPFELSASGNFNSIDDLLSTLNRSIRPIKINTMQVTGTNTELTLSITATTYYQPERTLDLQKKVIQ